MNQRYEGFLLIELLVAMAIMGILAIAIARYQSGALAIQYNTHRHMQAIALAGSKLDGILARKQLPTITHELHEQFIITYHVAAIAMRQLDIPAPLQAQKSSFYEVKVLVEWHDATQVKHRVSLAAGVEII